MSTYDAKQVLADYASGKLTPEMAVGHSLQHIDKLYEALNAIRQEYRAQNDTVDKRFLIMQTAVDRLVAFMDKVKRAQKSRLTSQHKPDQI